MSIQNGTKIVDMFSLECIGSFRWNAENGARFRSLRGKKPRREILALLKQQGVEILPETMRKIEYGEVQTVSSDIFAGLCKAYEVEFSSVLPSIKIGIPNSVFK
jgi:DNA-binding Xre family transcriptional regulator